MMNSRRSRARSLAVACVLVLAAASRVHATSGGITTQSFGPAGCNGCHFGGTMPTATLSGPTLVAPGDTNVYTLQVTAPGAQIRDASNRIILPTAIPPGTRVKYLVDGAGQVQRVWILSPEEAQR